MHCLCLLVVLVVCAYAQITPKNLAGPPSDFPFNSLPSPLLSSDIQNSAAYLVNLVPSLYESHTLTQIITLPVDSQLLFSFTFYSPYENDIHLLLVDPKGRKVDLDGKATYYPIGDTRIKGTDYKFKNPVSGEYELTIKTKQNKELFESLSKNNIPDAYIVLWNEDALSTHTSLNSYSLLTGNKVGLITRVFNSSFTVSDMKNGKVPSPLLSSIQQAEMIVLLPDGTTVSEPMQDDGLHEDGEANDGVYGGLITASSPGQYIFTATVTGTNGEGLNYARTTHQLVNVVNPTLTLSGNAIGVVDSSNTRMNILLVATAPTNTKYKTYAEVWGKDNSGNDLAIAWIGGMSEIQVYSGVSSLNMELDLNWISRVNAQGPITLKNVVIQEPESFIPIAQADEIPVTSSPISAIMSKVKDLLIREGGQITNEMREGKMPAKLTAKLNASAEATIILSHGYCSERNPFSVYASDWTNAQFFLSAKKNYPHDTFANAILDWAESFGPFSFVGHSQGGAVGLHIKTFYWSGLDLVEGGRILQSVGTPYQGSSGAGTAANLIKLFGILCGANEDLTKDGSELWLRSIPTVNRALVYYYTTTYVQGKLFGDYCNLATNLVLSWPNDGVAEYEYSQLPGAQNQGNVQGWCHSVDMKYDPQCENRDRNKEMNSLAARQVKPSI